MNLLPIQKIHITPTIIIRLTLAVVIYHNSVRILSLSNHDSDCAWHFLFVGPEIQILFPSHYIHTSSLVIVLLAFRCMINHASMLWMLTVAHYNPLGTRLLNRKGFERKILFPAKNIHCATDVEVVLIFFMVID